MVGVHAARKRRVRTLLGVLVALAVLGAGAWGVYQARLLPSGLLADEKCNVTTVDVTVAAPMEKAVRAATDSLGTSCRKFEVSTRSSYDVTQDLMSGKTLPDIWIPDSGWVLQQLSAAGVSTQLVSESLASSPFVLVGGPAVEAPANWGDALGSGEVAMPDPIEDTTGTLALLAPRAEADTVGRTDEQVSQLLVPLAQRYSEHKADGVGENLSLKSITATSKRLVPTTEQRYLEARRHNDLLRPVVPDTGALLVTYPMVVKAHPNAFVAEAASDIARWFQVAAGKKELADEGLRAGDGSQLGSGPGVGSVPYLPAPQGVDVSVDVGMWQVLSVPSSVLAVFDVSGSMDFRAGDKTRMQLAVDVALTALGIFPNQARIGLWVFSIDQGGPGRDWRVLEPMRRLDASVGGATQRARLQSKAQEMLDMTTGGTGLYDTTLAAYQQGLKDYDANYSNTVILLTDGANDDPGSISLDKLIAKLKKLHDPQRPVRIIGIGISQDADFAALSKIAKATGGQAYQADNPEDIINVFAQAIATR